MQLFFWVLNLYSQVQREPVQLHKYWEDPVLHLVPHHKSQSVPFGKNAHKKNEELYFQLNTLAQLVLSLSFWRTQEKRLTEMEERMDAVECYIRSNYATPLKLPQLAEKFGISYPNFRRLWQKRFSGSPHQLIMVLRNTEAKDLLQATNLSIGDIAKRTGFDEQRYFTRFFRTINGITPSDYRNISRNSSWFVCDRLDIRKSFGLSPLIAAASNSVRAKDTKVHW